MTASAPTPAQAVRLAPEHRFADELARLATADIHARPPGWRLSPRAVRQFILGGTTREILKTMTVPVLMSH